MKKVGRWIKLLLLVTILALLFWWIAQSEVVRESLADPEELRWFILKFGLLAPLGLIILQMFQTMISIIPSQLTTILAGFVFGPLWGLIYSLIGAFLGSLFIFLIARRYGHKVASFFFTEEERSHFILFFKQKKLLALFMARIAPLFPNDLVSFSAALTDISLFNFNLVSTAGFMIQMILLTFFGAELREGSFTLPLQIITLVISFLLALFLFKEKIHKILIHDLKLLEKGEKNNKEVLRKEVLKVKHEVNTAKNKAK
ncbi:MAG: TVP38/TMEM64 family protein [Nanoarchaeota archaeon]|nr:TVP38/TMEM64 family protein [Nanoarchaeota archaeon]